MVVKWLLYAVLLACSLAMLLLLAGFVSLRWGLAWLGSWIYLLAGHIILLAFFLLLIGSSGLLLRNVIQGLLRYFHREARAFRHLMALQILIFHTLQRQPLERRQLRYRYELKRQRIMANDDKKHSRALCKAIVAELKPSLEPERYRAVQKDLKQYRKQANLQAMLILRKQELRRCLSVG